MPNGEASRQRILDAAAEIAGERGYEGTSINLVSERSGLPASSIFAAPRRRAVERVRG